MNAFTISAAMKLPLKEFSLPEPEVEARRVRVATEVAEVLHRVTKAELNSREFISSAIRQWHAEHLRARQRHAVQARDERVAEGDERGEVAAYLAAAELRRVEVDVGAARAQVVELRGERRAVALGRVPLAAERAADARPKGVVTASFGLLSLKGVPMKPQTTGRVAGGGTPRWRGCARWSGCRWCQRSASR
jgi:hypothetical protein